MPPSDDAWRPWIRKSWRLCMDLFFELRDPAITMTLLQYLVTTVVLKIHRGDKTKASETLEFLTIRCQETLNDISDPDVFPGDKL